MARIKTLAFAAVTALAASTAIGASASASVATATPASGTVVVAESNAFLQNLAQAGIVVIPLPTATASYNSTTGASVTFPVTGGTGDISNFFGDIQLGGGLLVIDAKTHKSVCLHQVAFSIDNYALTAVPDGSTTPVSLLDVGDNATSSLSGVLPETLTSDADVDPAGAQFLNTALNTTAVTANAVAGSFNITFTPATS